MLVRNREADPVALMEEEVRRMRVGEAAAEKLAAARTAIALKGGGRGKASTVFFGSLVLKLKPAPEWGLGTMATDGDRLYYDPDFVMQVPPPQLIGVVVHEVMHCALGHHARQGGRDTPRWNEATDLVINPALAGEGFELPPGHLMPAKGKYAHVPAADLSAEEVYDLLDRAPGDKAPGDGDGEGDENPDPGGCGGVRPPPDGQAAAQASASRWKVDVAAAAQAVRSATRGELPGGLARLVGEVLAPAVDWKAVLREFVSRRARNDHSWRKPNRRLVGQGVYLPGLDGEELGEVVVAIDTSGSIDGPMIDRFGAEVQGVIDAYDCTLTVVHCDSKVQHVQHWRSGDGPLRLEPVGGGGTDHRPVFEWIDKQDGADNVCVICFTDLHTSFPDRRPEYPVLWAVVLNDNPSPPWGQVVKVKL